MAQESAKDPRVALDALIESAAHACEAEIAAILRLVGANLHRFASYGYTAELQEFLERHPFVLGRGSAIGHAALEGRTVHIPDVLADPEYSEGEAQRAGNYRAVVAVPLMRQGATIGVMVVARAAPGPFTFKQIKRLETFADQAIELTAAQT
jgi:two-component system, NtrC family, sensor kinase